MQLISNKEGEVMMVRPVERVLVKTTSTDQLGCVVSSKNRQVNDLRKAEKRSTDGRGQTIGRGHLY